MTRTGVLKRSGLCFATYSPYVTLGVCMPPYLAGRFTCGRDRASPKDIHWLLTALSSSALEI